MQRQVEWNNHPKCLSVERPLFTIPSWLFSCSLSYNSSAAETQPNLKRSFEDSVHSRLTSSFGPSQSSCRPTCCWVRPENVSIGVWNTTLLGLTYIREITGFMCKSAVVNGTAFVITGRVQNPWVILEALKADSDCPTAEVDHVFAAANRRKRGHRRILSVSVDELGEWVGRIGVGAGKGPFNFSALPCCDLAEEGIFVLIRALPSERLCHIRIHGQFRVYGASVTGLAVGEISDCAVRGSREYSNTELHERRGCNQEGS